MKRFNHDWAAADAAAIETIRQVIDANDQRRQVIDELERKLAEAQALALANGMRADAAERRTADLELRVQELSPLHPWMSGAIQLLAEIQHACQKRGYGLPQDIEKNVETWLKNHPDQAEVADAMTAHEEGYLVLRGE